jgi:hypothetical protein
MRKLLLVTLAWCAVAAPGLTCTTSLARHDVDSDEVWRCPAVVAAAWRVGWPVHQLAWVDRIAWRESGCRADAWSPTRDAGAMQIHHRWIGWGLCRAGIACRVAELFDLDVNLRAAAHVYAVQGPGAWTTS